MIDDGLGHTYYATICGRTTAHCLPMGWTETYEYGAAIQFWGQTPGCNASDPSTLCLDHDGQIPVCCTPDCQVLGVGAPKFSLMNDSDPFGGIQMQFQGAPPDDDDPFWCPWNPQTGSQYPRTVEFNISCVPDVSGAMPMSVVQNRTEDCEYAR